MEKILHKYTGTRGSVRLIHDGIRYCVDIEVFDGACTRRSQIARGTYDAAWTLYLQYWQNFNPNVPSNKLPRPIALCTFPGRNCKCVAKKCPRELGGIAFYQLFRDACLYRTK